MKRSLLDGASDQQSLPHAVGNPTPDGGSPCRCSTIWSGRCSSRSS
jgi:hypothetical protein